MIFAVRHGERADESYSEYEKKRILLKYDPPLTKIGKEESVLTGIYFNDFSQQNNLKMPIIISSPFLRCFETALIISQQLKLFYDNTIYVEDGLSEFLHYSFFENNIIDDLLTKNYKFLQGLNLNGISVKFNNISKVSRKEIQYPEIFKDFFKRTQLTINDIKNFFLENFDFKKYYVIIVSHGYIIQCFLDNYLALQKFTSCDYCSISMRKYDVKTNKSKILMNSSCEHIKIKKSRL